MYEDRQGTKNQGFLIELELYFKAQLASKNDKITIAITFLKKYVLMWWTQFKDKNVETFSWLTRIDTVERSC